MLKVGDLQGLQRPIRAWREEIEEFRETELARSYTCECKNGFKRKMEFQVKVIHID